MTGISIIFPFLAIVLAALGMTLPDQPVWTYVCWGLAAVLVLLWVLLDLKWFVALFQRKGAKYGASSGLVLILGIAIILALGYLSNRPRFNLSYDVTSDKVNTLTDQSRKVIDQIGDKKLTIEVTAFFKDEEVRQRFKDLFHLYTQTGADFRVEYLNTDQQPLKVESAGLTNPNTVILKNGEKEHRITAFTEEKITSGLLAVIKDGAKKLYFTTGHGESSIDSQEAEGSSFVVGELQKNRYEVAELSLLENAKIPDDASAIFIVGPKYDFKEEETRFVDEYLKKGGALFVLVDALVAVPRLNALIGKYGITFESDFVIFSPEDPRAQFFGQNNSLVTWFDEFNPLTRDFARDGAMALMFPQTRSLTAIESNDRNMKTSVVAKTANNLVRVKGVASPNDLKAGIDPSSLEKGEFSVVAVATGEAMNDQTAANTQDKSEEKSDAGNVDGLKSGAPIRVVAVGSSHLGSNAGISRGVENLDMFLNISNYLVQDEDLISIRPKEKKQSKLGVLDVSAKLWLVWIQWLYPLFFLVLGIVFWTRRRMA